MEDDGFPYFKIYDEVSDGDDPDGMRLLCTHRIFEKKGLEFAAWMTSDPERVKLLRTLFDAFTGSGRPGEGDVTEDVGRLAVMWRTRLRSWGKKRFPHWLKNAVEDLLTEDGGLTQDRIASLLGVDRKTLYRSEEVRRLMDDAKARRQVGIPKRHQI